MNITVADRLSSYFKVYTISDSPSPEDSKKNDSLVKRPNNSTIFQYGEQPDEPQDCQNLLGSNATIQPSLRIDLSKRPRMDLLDSTLSRLFDCSIQVSWQFERLYREQSSKRKREEEEAQSVKTEVKRRKTTNRNRCKRKREYEKSQPLKRERKEKCQDTHAPASSEDTDRQDFILPDELTCYILSLLPRKDQQSASQVSRSWRALTFDTIKRQEHKKMEDCLNSIIDFLKDQKDYLPLIDSLKAISLDSILEAENFEQLRKSVFKIRGEIADQSIVLKDEELVNLGKLQGKASGFFANFCGVVFHYQFFNQYKNSSEKDRKKITNRIKILRYCEDLAKLGYLEKILQVTKYIPFKKEGRCIRRFASLLISKDSTRILRNVNSLVKRIKKIGNKEIRDVFYHEISLFLIEKGFSKKANKIIRKISDLSENSRAKNRACRSAANILMKKHCIEETLAMLDKVELESTPVKDKILGEIVTKLIDEERVDEALKFIDKIKNIEIRSIKYEEVVTFLAEKQGDIPRAQAIASLISTGTRQRFAEATISLALEKQQIKKEEFKASALRPVYVA